jgi:hypothetical protein
VAQTGFRAAFEEFREQSGSSFFTPLEVGDAVGAWVETEEEEEVFPEESEPFSTLLPHPRGNNSTETALQTGNQLHDDDGDADAVEYEHFGEWLDLNASFQSY